MKYTNRIESLDIMRGVAMIFIILFHSSIYNFANIHRIDLDNPPLVIILISFLALWGGIFIIYSMTMNAIMIAKRSQEDRSPKIFIYLTYASLIYLGLHYLLNMFLGRWSIDFINNQPNLTFIASTLRELSLTLPSAIKFFGGSSLSTIALNLLIVSWILYLLFKKNGQKRITKNYFILGSLGFIIMLISFTRVYLYDLFIHAQESSNYPLSLIYSFLLANPYPLLPYLAYGFFGALIGLLIYNKKNVLLKKIIIPIGLLFLLFGIFGMMNFEKTISKPDFFWYFKTNFELGIFLLLIPGVYLLFEKKKRFLNKLSILKWFSRVSLTIYMLETALSEIIRIIIRPIMPTWDQTLNSCLFFGLINIIIWTIILIFWHRNNFKYSLEYFWVKFFNKIGKDSTKMNFD